ncbi:ead/Ea22-like family protein [Citrobacter freundii]|nr:ead/Ea22-like family protein [Citrobacter freundii]
MTELNKQALREAANAANTASWGKWESYKPHKGARGYEVKVGVKAVAQHCLKVDAAFIAAANPSTMLALLDENLQLQRDKDSLEAAAIAMRDDMREAREKLEAAEKRNAELVHNHRVHAARLIDERGQLKQRIAELEARTVTVKLPADYRNSDGNINADMFNTCEVVGAFRDALAASGIGVKGE